MFKQKSFISRSQNTSTFLQEPFQKYKIQNPKSQHQKKFIRLFYSPNKSYEHSITEKNNIECSTTKQLNTSYNQGSSPFICSNPSQRYQKLHSNHIKKTLIEQNFNFSRCRSELIRNQSLNQIHKSHRILMLTQMNAVLYDNSQHITMNLQQPNPEQTLNKNKVLFQNKINAKIDRLQGFLYKIKNQRQKQEIPRNKIQPQLVNPSSLHQQRQIKPNNQKSKDNASHILLELNKLKEQLAKTRNQAIQIKKRNSVSRDKNVTELEIDSHFKKIKQQIEKINRPKTQTPSQSSPNIQECPLAHEISFQKNQRNQSFHLMQNPRHNNHINQNPSQRSSKDSPFQYHRNKHLDSKTVSKPKITFSFAQKT